MMAIYLDILYRFISRYIIFWRSTTLCWKTEKQHPAFIEDDETSKQQLISIYGVSLLIIFVHVDDKELRYVRQILILATNV